MLVERADVLQRVDEILASAGLPTGADQRGVPRTPGLLVHGVAGVGKTSVLAEAAARARRIGYAVRSSVASAAEQDWPYASLDRLLRSLDGGPGGPGLDPKAPPLVAAGELLDVVVTIALPAPLVVVVDDVQWLDELSAWCLSFVLRRLAHDQVVFMLGRRDEPGEAARTQGAEAGLARFEELELVGLDSLSRSGALVVVQGLGACASVAEAVVDHCGGLPMALTEVTAALSPAQRSGRAALPTPMPASTPELGLRERLKSLGTGQCLAAAAAAVCVQGAAPALGPVLDSLGVRACLEDLERVGLLTLEETGPRWFHPLARAAALASVPAATLRTINTQAAQALAEVQAEPDVVAWLRVAGAEGPSESLALEVESVARRAEAIHAHAAAADAWQRAADIGTDAGRKAVRLGRSACRRIYAGDVQAGSELGRQALALGLEPHERYEVLLAVGRAAATGATSEQAVELLAQAAQAAAETGDPRARVMALAARINPSLHLANARITESLATRVLEAHDPTDPYQAFLAHAAHGFAALNAERAEEGQAALEFAVAICGRSSFLSDHSELLGFALQALMWSGNPLLLRDEVLKALDVSRRRGELVAVCDVLRGLALCDHDAGRAESAQRLAAEALELARDVGRPKQLTGCLTVAATIEGLRGNRELAVSLARESARVAAVMDSTWTRADAAWAETFACLSAGDSPAAATAAAPLVELVLAGRLAAWQANYFDAAIALATAGDVTQARAVRDALVGRLSDHPSPDSTAGLALADAASGRLDAASAVRLLTETADVLDRIDQRVWRGRLWLSAGSILRRSGRRTLARTHLSSALEDFRQIGALAWVERVNDELRACGVKVGSARSEPLTGAELRVAAAVAGGLTNREVASTLFLSTKTVEFHLAHVYRKLGVRNRSGLARAMHSRAASVG